MPSCRKSAGAFSPSMAGTVAQKSRLQTACRYSVPPRTTPGQRIIQGVRVLWK